MCSFIEKISILNNGGSIIKYNFPSMCTIFHRYKHIRDARVCSQVCINIYVHTSVSMCANVYVCVHSFGLV